MTTFHTAGSEVNAYAEVATNPGILKRTSKPRKSKARKIKRSRSREALWGASVPRFNILKSLPLDRPEAGKRLRSIKTQTNQAWPGVPSLPWEDQPRQVQLISPRMSSCRAAPRPREGLPQTHGSQSKGNSQPR